MKINLKFYHFVSLAKIILWLFILLVTYTYINIYEDPTIAISLWFIWIFISIRWISFFLFLWGQKLFRKTHNLRIIKDSYKLSLLFGIYCIINILLLILWSWNKIWWFILFGWFILIQILLLENKIENTDEK